MTDSKVVQAEGDTEQNSLATMYNPTGLFRFSSMSGLRPSQSRNSLSFLTKVEKTSLIEVINKPFS